MDDFFANVQGIVLPPVSLNKFNRGKIEETRTTRDNQIPCVLLGR